MKKLILFLFSILLIVSCKKEDEAASNTDNQGPQLIFRMQIDSTQERLNVMGQPSTLPTGHSAQSPEFHGIAVRYIELTPTAYTPLMGGTVVYNSPRTNGKSGGIIFDELKVINDGEVAFSIPLEHVAPGTYNYARVSVVYQNYEIDFRANGMDLTGRLASFVGDTVFIDSYKINKLTDNVNANKIQGYWAFETPQVVTYPAQIIRGQAKATTVPNVLFSTSPTPPGGCIVTGQFPSQFTITGDETESVVVDLSFSTNKSFEYSDANGNGVYEPVDGDTVVDMGLRGLIPKVAL